MTTREETPTYIRLEEYAKVVSENAKLRKTLLEASRALREDSGVVSTYARLLIQKALES